MQPVILNPSEKVCDFFTYEEVIFSDTALRLEIDNEIYDPAILERVKFVGTHVLDPVRRQFGSFRPNSWFRCEQLEFEICKRSFWRKTQSNNPDLHLPNEGWRTLTWDIISNPAHQLHEHWKAYFDRKQHPKGASVDFEVSGVSNDELFKWCKENIEDFDQLIREFPKPNVPNSGWVHCSKLFSGNRGQSFKIG